jgi:hypothetical protein
MQAIGLVHAPVYLLGDISDTDQVRFNQIHNSADIEIGGCRVRINRQLDAGWHVVEPSVIEDISRTTKASQLSEILKLLSKFGEWGNAVADTTGRILASPLYALACHNLRRPLRVAVVPQQKAVKVLQFLGNQYGEFSYDHLPEQMWTQIVLAFRLLWSHVARGRSPCHSESQRPDPLRDVFGISAPHFLELACVQLPFGLPKR